MRKFSNLINKTIKQKYIHEFDVNNDDDKIIDIFVELICSLSQISCDSKKTKINYF